jgi:hypothetical protein
MRQWSFTATAYNVHHARFLGSADSTQSAERFLSWFEFKHAKQRRPAIHLGVLGKPHLLGPSMRARVATAIFGRGGKRHQRDAAQLVGLLSAGITTRIAVLPMHDQAGLSGNALSQRSFFHLQRQICRLTEQLKRRLDLCPSANRSLIELLQANLLRAHHP